MPIRSLESLLFENKLVNTSSIEVLRNATIGIDVEHYLSRIYTFKKEQCLFGIGGVPTSLKQYLESDLKVFKDVSVVPLFVLPGLNTNLTRKQYEVNELSPQEQHLNATWTRLKSKQAVSGGTSFGHTGDSFRLNLDPLPTSLMENDLIKLFIELGVNFMISPYDASFQLSYLIRNGTIDCIYGSTDLLLSNTDKFILGMEFQSREFRFVDKKKVLTELKLTERQFIDLSIMVGCSVQPETFSIFPSVPKSSPHSSFSQVNHFRMALDILFQLATAKGPPADLSAHITSLNDPRLVELYNGGHTAIEFMPVMKDDGQVDLISIEQIREDSTTRLFKDVTKLNEDSCEDSAEKQVIPAGLHSVLSQRLPAELHFYQSLGLLPSKLLEAVTTGEYFIRPPLAIGQGNELKKVLISKKFQDLLDYHFNLISQLLARYYQVKRIKVYFWFQAEPVYLNNRMELSVSAKFKNADLYKMSLGDSTSPWSCIKETAETDASKNNSNKKDIMSITFRRALFLLQVFGEDGGLNWIGRTMRSFCQEHSDVDTTTLENLYLILSLLDSEGLRSVKCDDDFGKFVKVPGGNFSDIDLKPDEVSSVFLVSRIFALEKFDIHPINYQGPISRSLLTSRSIFKIFQEMARDSSLVSLVDLIVRDEELKAQMSEKSTWDNLMARLPFFNDLKNTLLGVVSEIFFSACIKASKQGFSPADSAGKSKEYLINTVFQVGKPSHNIDLHGANSVTPDQYDQDFKRGLELWSHFTCLTEIIKKSESSILSDADYELVERADRIVQMFTANS